MRPTSATGRRRRLVLDPRRPDGRRDQGYVAVVTALLLSVFMGLLGFALDVGHWYLVGEQAQRAADAAALGGVPNLPNKPVTAFAAAQSLAALNGFADGTDGVTVTAALDKKPTRLRVTISRTVNNVIGPLLGVPRTTITRTAVADYAGPVAMGSPCNEFGNDPESAGKRGSACPTDSSAGSAGQFWANVGGLRATKVSGDAFLNGKCGSGVDNCSGTNSELDPNGYFYSVTLTKAVSTLTIQAFDPAFVAVGDKCDSSAAGMSGTPSGAAKILVTNSAVLDPAIRYAGGPSSPYCSGDTDLESKGGLMSTTFKVRNPGVNVWDPLSYPVRSGCTTTYGGWKTNLANALDKSKPQFDAGLASVFRQWKTLCTISNAQPGTYLIQVTTQDLTSLDNGAHNRFSLRAYGTTAADNDAISLSGYDKMAIFANLPDAKTNFHLARVPSGAAGQTLNVKLFDIGDSTGSGNIQIIAPPASGVTFAGCTLGGAAKGSAATCALTADSSYNGRWATVAVPVPPAYTCNDLDPSDCWVRLRYNYGTGNQPSDTTSWTASIEGDPVRLVE